MPSRYHPIYDGLWDDDALEGARFECKAFFAFLCSNRRLRPSGIYRVTDQQLVADTGLSVKRVQGHLAELVNRRRIVRDGAWMFVRGYLARQPKHDNLLSASRSNVSECSSRAVLEAFAERYPVFRQWSADRLATVEQPLNENRPQSSTRAVPEQSSTEHRTVGQPSGNGHVASSILAALERSPRLGAVPRLRLTAFWHAEAGAAGGTVDLAAEVLKAEAWLIANPARARKDLPRFLHNWFAEAKERQSR